MYDDLRTSYQATALPCLHLGAIKVAEKLIEQAPAFIVLKSLNRHGLIAGATGSGKTKTIQTLCEQLSLAGVPSLVMDIKGDLSGLAVAGSTTEFLTKRSQDLHITYTPRAFPTELLTLNPALPGIPLRASVASFGSLLFARMLNVNETQEGVVTILFEFAKQENIPLLTLADVKSLVQYAQSDEGKVAIAGRFGNLATTSLSTIMRKVIELEAQGGDEFFGEPAFAVQDLLRVDQQGLGVISVLRLMDMQDKPKLFSTFMLKLLADLYRLMPELGDPERPKLLLFIDEAHLIFNQASKALLSLLDTMVKLIRSKGIGLIFCTQTPDDIPENILSQLGLKIQHALRAFTAKDRKAMKLVAQNFPPSKHYQTEELLTSLGIGEALVCALDSKGQPTELIQCVIRAPESRMGILTDSELKTLVSRSTLLAKYQQRQHDETAQKVLAGKRHPPLEDRKTDEKESINTTTVVGAITKNTLFRQVIRQIMRDVTRAILAALGIKRPR